MPNLLNASTLSGLPAAKAALVKSVCQRHGPVLLGDRYPKGPDGLPKSSLSNSEVASVAEMITREFWRQQMEAEAVAQASESAAASARSSNATDPFA